VAYVRARVGIRVFRGFVGALCLWKIWRFRRKKERKKVLIE